MWRVDLDDVVALRTQSAEAHQVFHVLRRKQIFAGRERGCIARRDLAEQSEIERVAWLLEPTQPQRSKRIGIGKCLRASEFGVGVDRKLRMGRQRRLDRFHPPHVLDERQTSDLHLDHGVTGIEMAVHLVLQIFQRLPGGVPATADVAEDPVCHRAGVVALGQQAMQRLAGDLGHRVPDRDLDRADGDRALTVAAGFLPFHHDGENFFRIEILLRVVEQRSRICPDDAGDEACTHCRAAGVAAGRVEREADDRPPFAHDVGDDRHHRGRHLGEIETRIADVRLQRDRAFADVDDTHGVYFNSC